MTSRRVSKTDDQTAAAIKKLVTARTEVLYALGAAVRDLEAARAAVLVAENTEREALAQVVRLSDKAVADGWSAAQLREAGLSGGAAPARRATRGKTPATPAPEQTPATPAAEPAATAPAQDQAPAAQTLA